MTTPVLRVENLTLITESQTIVDNLSFDIGKGEIIALTGRSGSGKSSIAAVILNMLPPGMTMQSGHIHWLGTTPLTLPEDQKTWNTLRGTHIGFSQQDVFGAFDPVMKMGKQMESIIRARAKRSNFNILHELYIKMEEVGLHDIDRILDSYPHELSGGQLQRCQVAMTIVLRPDLLILDEPTSAVDKINQAELLHVFKMVREKYNIAMLCITHEEDVVKAIASKKVILAETSVGSDIVADEASVAAEEGIPGESSIVLDVQHLRYTHAYSGLFDKAGAEVGPIDFQAASGKCLGIVGASGSGKSTLAQLLVGLLTPLEGKISLDNRTIDLQRNTDIRRLRSKVQLVMQDGRGSLHPHRTVSEILEEVSEMRKKEFPAIASDVNECLKDVRMPPDVLTRLPGELSGGECLRISIARALLASPEVLILDESTASLDGATTKEILKLLRRLMTTRHLALLFISHDPLVMREMADEIIVLAEGKVIEHGRADDILNRPTHHVTKRIFSLSATFENKN